MNAPPASLAAVAWEDEADFYPRAALEGAGDALVLFAAGFWGRQDAVWVARAGLQATCVDIDGPKLEWMAGIYPPSWEFVRGTVFAYAAGMDGKRQWDVVSLDPPTHLFQQCSGLVPLWARLARRAVILGCSARHLPETPDGWQALKPLQRSNFNGGVAWATFMKEAV